MKPIQVPIRQIGNSKGVVIPKPLLSQAGFGEAVDMSVEGDAIILRASVKRAVRAGWAEAARAIAAEGHDELVMGEFGNEADKDLAW